jgi:hypothetical protein
MTTVVETVILTSGTSWIVPNTWNSSNNTVSCIGGGGGARLGGGGGGARVINTNVSLTPGANISYTIGAGGTGGTTPTAGGSTTFNSSAMIAVGGGPASSANVNGGFGGTAASSTGTTKYSGGNGGAGAADSGGGAGGAGGTTANGSNGSAGSGETGGNGGAGGNTGGGAGGIGVNQGTGGSGFPGFDTGISSASYGSNYSGGGGAGGGTSTDKGGTSYYNGGSGGLFGGGGGGAGRSSPEPRDGAQGGIIIEWTWQTTLPAASEAIQSSTINSVLRRSSNNTINYNETIVRSLANVVTTNTQISSSNFHSKNQDATFITNSLVQFDAGTTTLNLPGSIEVGDLVIFTGIFGLTTRPQVITPGWTFTGNNSVALDTAQTYATGAFYRVFQTGDTSIQVVNPTAGFAGIFTVFRGPSRAIAIGKVNGVTGTSLTFSGITKSAISKRLFTVVIDRDPSTNATAPSGFTEHTRRAGTFFAIESASIRSIAYTNGSSIGWTNFVNSFRQTGMLLELE